MLYNRLMQIREHADPIQFRDLSITVVRRVVRF